MFQREQLISEWRKQLALSQQPASDGTGRAAWLARVRARLYRFLLSLYGDGSWNAPTHTDAEETKEGVVLDASDVLPFAGKPARQISELRNVLEAVSRARDQIVQAGPLASGLKKDSWIVVACLKHAEEAARYEFRLRNCGIAARLVRRGHESTVEVMAPDRAAALQLMDQWRANRRSRPAKPSPSPVSLPRDLVHYLLCGTVAGPVAGVVAAIVLHYRYESHMPSDLAAVFLAIWLACIPVSGLLYLLKIIVVRGWARASEALDIVRKRWH